MHSRAARILFIHMTASLNGYLYITQIRSVKDQLNKLLSELSTFFALNFMFLKDARVVAWKTQATYSCLQSSISTNYWPKCWSPDYGGTI